MPAQLNPALVKPLRLNFAQVCVWCGTRWCQSPTCVARHDASVWQICPDCQGGTDRLTCDCYGGVIEAPSPAFRATMATLANPTTDTPADLTGLTNGQLAVALHLGGLPTHYQHLTTADLIALVRAGIARVGLAEIRRLDTVSRQAVLAAFAHRNVNPTNPGTAEWARVDRVWSSAAAQQRATGAAYTLRNLLKPTPTGTPTATAARTVVAA
jgi:hypothetical protein